jgi:hypothetical protein
MKKTARRRLCGFTPVGCREYDLGMNIPRPPELLIRMTYAGLCLTAIIVVVSYYFPNKMSQRQAVEAYQAMRCNAPDLFGPCNPSAK